ncbi:MAG: hypothetical protein ACM3QZ_11730 [Solirubrobacterales bacterium]
MMSEMLILLCCHVLFGILVGLTGFFPGLDFVAAIGYLVFLGVYSIRLRERFKVRLRVFWIVTVAQLPGLIGTAGSLYAWKKWGQASTFYDFFLHFWHSASVPFLAALPVVMLGQTYLTYILYLILSPLYVLFAVFLPDLFGWIPVIRRFVRGSLDKSE